MPYDIYKHQMPEGHEVKFGDKRRTGSICSVSQELHTIEELIGKVECPCGNANVVTPEPEE